MDSLKSDVLLNGKKIRQGYLDLNEGKKLANDFGILISFEPCEVRLRDKEGKRVLTVKGAGGLERGEVEAIISKELFEEYWPKTKGKRVVKVRLEIPEGKYKIEVDVYTDRDLIVAEVEFPNISDSNSFVQIGKDVTEELQFKNKNLAK